MALKDTLVKLKTRFLPPSSRSFYQRTSMLLDQIALLEQARCEDRQLIEALRREVAQATVQLSNEVRSFEERSRIRWESLYAHPGESEEEIKRRFFAAIPPAIGIKRDFQLANARLLHEFHELCMANNLTYWVCFGSLVAVVSRGGSIPWDDDIDICMMRDDVDRLIEIVKGDPRLQITVAYDGYVFCQQIRFSLKDDRIPCFIDVCPWEWAIDSSESSDAQLRDLRLSLMEEFRQTISDFACWRDYPILYIPGSGKVVQCDGYNHPQPDEDRAREEIRAIEAVFEKYENVAKASGLFCDKADAAGLAYGLRNIYDAPWRKTVFPCDIVLPTKTLRYEGYDVCVPCEYETVCDECYPGWPYLPQDILGHEHMSKDILEDSAVQDALSRYAEGEEL